MRRRWDGLDGRRREAVCWLLLLAPVLVVLWPLWLAGHVPIPDYLPYFAPWHDLAPARTVWNPLWYDALGQYWPWRCLLTDGLRANALPYWNPYQFGGYPFAANGQSALFYPPNWLFFGLFGVANGFRLTAIGHLWLAGLGTYGLLRELGASRASSLLGGVAFELSGFMVLWLPLPTLISSAAWLPVAAACLERARRFGEGRWSLAAGAAVGLSALAGHPQVFYYVGLFSAALLVTRLRPSHWPRFAAMAGLLAAVQLLPVLEMAPRGHRPVVKSEAAYRGFLGRAIGLERLVTLAQPRFFGNPARGTVEVNADPRVYLRQATEGRYWGLDRNNSISPGDYAEFNLFCGLLPLLLALLAWWRGGPARLYGGLAAVGLALAFGLPLNRLLYLHFPGWAAGAGPCRLALWWCFGVAVSAGLGCDALRRLPRRAPWLAAGALLAAHVGFWLIAGGRLAGLQALLDATQLARLLGAALVVAWLAAGGLLATRARRWLPLAVAAELVLFGVGAVPSTAASRLDRGRIASWLTTTGGVEAGQRVVCADSPRLWGFYQPPEGLLLPPNLATAGQLRDAGGYDSLMLAATKDRLSQLAGREPISPLINGNMLLLGHLRALPAGTARGLPQSPPGQPRTLGALRVDRANRVAIELPVGHHELFDTAYPGWQALGPDGRALNWYGPLGGPRAFDLASGGVVRFVFRPMTVRLGLFLGLLALGLAAACCAGVRLATTKAEA